MRQESSTCPSKSTLHPSSAFSARGPAWVHCIIRLLCPGASNWVWPTGILGWRWKERRRLRGSFAQQGVVLGWFRAAWVPWWGHSHLTEVLSIRTSSRFPLGPEQKHPPVTSPGALHHTYGFSIACSHFCKYTLLHSFKGIAHGLACMAWLVDHPDWTGY